MSTDAVNWAVSLPREKVNGSTRMVLIILAHHYNNKNGYSHPGVGLLAAEAGLSTGQTRAHIRKLEADNLISIVEGSYSHGGRRCTRRYKLTGMPVGNNPPAGRWVKKENPPVHRQKPTGRPPKTHRPTGGEQLEHLESTDDSGFSNEKHRHQSSYKINRKPRLQP